MIGFKVTAVGLTVDKCVIMPGSGLILNNQPPSHWQRFGAVLDVPHDAAKTLTVATPDAATGSEDDSSDGSVEPATRETLATATKPQIIAALKVAGVEFDGRANVDVLRDLAGPLFENG